MIASDPTSLHPVPQLSHPPSAPPESWVYVRRLAKRIVVPIERFLHIQAASGIVLMIAAVVAIVWANSPWSASYEHLWHTPVGFTIGSFTAEQTLHFVINDILMVIFFFVVGLEIRREMHEGELSELKRAALPALAAVGGMVAPAIIYMAFAHGSAASRGWGVPMATDIAFAVGVLALLGNRVPSALRVLLLALAIIDDIGAIIVIAVFFSSGFSFMGLGVAALGLAGIIGMQRIGVRSPFAYIVPGVVIWAGVLQAGVHPTIAGVIVGLMTPVVPWYGARGFRSITRRVLRKLEGEQGGDDHVVAQSVARLTSAANEAQAPAARLEHALHPIVAFGIMPVFALANAGVSVQGLDFSGSESGIIATGIVLGLVVGKPLGVVAASWLGVKIGLCSLPRGVDWKGVTVVGCVAGIGFTMAVFVAGLAFTNSAHLGVAKLAVLCASVLAAVGTIVGARFLLAKPMDPAVASITPGQAEASTDF